MKYNKLKKINKYAQVKKEKVKNYGLSILKSVMAFLVLSHHCFNPRSTKNKIILYINKKKNTSRSYFFYHIFLFYV